MPANFFTKAIYLSGLNRFESLVDFQVRKIPIGSRIILEIKLPMPGVNEPSVESFLPDISITQ